MHEPTSAANEEKLDRPMSAAESDVDLQDHQKSGIVEISQKVSEAASPPAQESLDHDSDRAFPPRDTGRAAWKVLSGGVIYYAAIVGFPLTFGVFQQYFYSHETFGAGASTVWVGVLSGGVPFLGAPFMSYLCQRYPNVPLRYYLVLGWLICVVALVAAAFCRTLVSIVLTQGLCYGIGFFVLDVPTLLILNTWFLKRRGLAYGTLFALSDLFGFILSYVATALLSNCGLRTTLLSFAGIVLVLPGVGIWLLHERPTPTVPLPESSPDSQMKPGLQLPVADFRCCTPGFRGGQLPFYHRPIFYMLSLANLLQSFAFYLPFIYLPSYTADLGFTTTESTTVLAVANLSQIIGEFAFGKMSDFMNVRGLCVMGSSLGASLATFFIWGWSGTYAQTMVFAIVYGSFASGLISLWARIGVFFGEKDSQKIYNVMSFGRGIGNIASGPLSAALLADDGMQVVKGTYAMGKYKPIVLFVGACMGASASLGALGFVAVAAEEAKVKKMEEAAANDRS